MLKKYFLLVCALSVLGGLQANEYIIFPNNCSCCYLPYYPTEEVTKPKCYPKIEECSKVWMDALLFRDDHWVRHMYYPPHYPPPTP